MQYLTDLNMETLYPVNKSYHKPSCQFPTTTFILSNSAVSFFFIYFPYSKSWIMKFCHSLASLFKLAYYLQPHAATDGRIPFVILDE